MFRLNNDPVCHKTVSDHGHVVKMCPDHRYVVKQCPDPGYVVKLNRDPGCTVKQCPRMMNDYAKKY